MVSTRARFPVGRVELVCAFAALGVLAATLTWDMGFIGIVALILVLLLYAVLRDLRKLWHIRKPGMPAPSEGKGDRVEICRADAARDRNRDRDRATAISRSPLYERPRQR
jgi:hypothetical protein